MAKTYDLLQALAAEVKNAVKSGENTANRIGSLFVDLVEKIKDVDDTKTKEAKGAVESASKYPFRKLGDIAYSTTSNDELNNLLDNIVENVGIVNADGWFRLTYGGVLYDLRQFVLTAASDNRHIVQRVTGAVSIQDGGARIHGGSGVIRTVERTYRFGSWGNYKEI